MKPHQSPSVIKFTVSILIFLLLAFPAILRGATASYIPDNAPNSRYTIHTNGTVADQNTGLMWKRCLEDASGNLGDGGTPAQSDWAEALLRAKTSVSASYFDWRLPNISELSSLIETNRNAPAVNESIFPEYSSICLQSIVFTRIPPTAVLIIPSGL